MDDKMGKGLAVIIASKMKGKNYDDGADEDSGKNGMYEEMAGEVLDAIKENNFSKFASSLKGFVKSCALSILRDQEEDKKEDVMEMEDE